MLAIVLSVDPPMNDVADIAALFLRRPSKEFSEDVK